MLIKTFGKGLFVLVALLCLHAAAFEEHLNAQTQTQTQTLLVKSDKALFHLF